MLNLNMDLYYINVILILFLFGNRGLIYYFDKVYSNLCLVILGDNN